MLKGMSSNEVDAAAATSTPRVLQLNLRSRSRTPPAAVRASIFIDPPRGTSLLPGLGVLRLVHTDHFLLYSLRARPRCKNLVAPVVASTRSSPLHTPSPGITTSTITSSTRPSAPCTITAIQSLRKRRAGQEMARLLLFRVSDGDEDRKSVV